jgi:hypothetical protein
LAVAAVAAAKVSLAPRHHRFWSRPLVAALYLLQPIVRGWPRYARRLRSTETPVAARATVRALAKQYENVGSVFTVNYWNEEGVERFVFLQKLLEVLERDQWQARADSGWDEYDVTIYGDRFTKVNVKTVAENHGGNKRLLRGRLTAHWTLLGKAFLWTVVAFVAIFLAVTAHALWALSAWLLVVLVAAYLHLRALRTLRLGAALLDLSAQELGLIKLNAPKKFEKPA